MKKKQTKKVEPLESFEVLSLNQKAKIFGGDDTTTLTNTTTDGSRACTGGDTTLPTSPTK